MQTPDRIEWNTLVRAHMPRFGGFLQSWEWGEFQASIGRDVRRLAIERNGKQLVAQAVQLPLPFGWSYWFLPKGPLGSMPMQTAVRELTLSIPDGAFFRTEPGETCRGWQAKDMNPSTSSILDLTVGWDALADGMKAKTRYNIRLAEKKGVTIQIAGLEAFDDFTRLLEQTATRDGFSLHPLEYYASMLRALADREVRAFLAIARYEGRPIAANLMIDFNGQRTYLHGASSNLHRNVMAPYLLHKYLIVDAIEKGMTSYDFWGVAPVGSSLSHPWAGVTRFKLGFGGEIVSMPGTIDVPTNIFIYALYRAARLWRKPRRRQREIATE